MSEEQSATTSGSSKNENKSLRYFLVFVVVVVLLFLGGLSILKSKHIKINFTKPLTVSSCSGGAKAPPTPSEISEQVETNKNIVQWIYDNSKYISKKTCRRIYKIVFAETKYPLLMLALIRRESNFNPVAISDKGAIGLCQVMWEAHSKQLQESGIAQEKRDLFDIETNIKASNLIFTTYLKMCNQDLQKALTRYVGGYHSTYSKDILEYLGEVYLVSKKHEFVMNNKNQNSEKKSTEADSNE